MTIYIIDLSGMQTRSLKIGAMVNPQKRNDIMRNATILIARGLKNGR